LLLSLCLTGCATIFNGRTQRLVINSNVPGAVVKIDGQVVGQTPFLGDMLRNTRNRTITVEAGGFLPQSQSMIFKRDHLKALWLNTLPTLGAIGGTVPLWGRSGNNPATFSIIGGGFLWSLVSIIVDYNRSSVYQYEPKTFYFYFVEQ